MFGSRPSFRRKALAASTSVKRALPSGSTNASMNFTESASCRAYHKKALALGGHDAIRDLGV